MIDCVVLGSNPVAEMSRCIEIVTIHAGNHLCISGLTLDYRVQSDNCMRILGNRYHKRYRIYGSIESHD